jgi:phenylalanyl-tRNA synthetase beta chain
MRVSLNWLKDFIDVKGGVEKIQEELIMTGLEVTSVIDIEGDKVMDIEVTPNRLDCLSILGIARELGAALDKSLKLPSAVKKNYAKKAQSRSGAKIDVADKKGCRRYVGCVIKNVKIGPSPKWLSERLNAIGVRSINNVVDITNYVLFELGQPLHAFDLDKLIGKKIIVRRAKKGEDIVTIDGIKRELDPEMLVIADAERPVAIAGIMGGKDAEISPDTKNVLLESAYFDPMIIRRAQRRLGLASESSYRFERGVDFSMVLSASVRAQEMIRDIAGGRFRGTITDIGGKRVKEREIVLLFDETERILGIEIGVKEVMDFFKRLHLRPVRKGKNKISVRVPSYRRDLERDIDLIEEIARLYGYDRIPVKSPVFTVQKNYIEEKRDKVYLENEARKILYSMGMNEIITYTLTSRFSIEILGHPFDNVVRLANPLSSNQEFMRPSLLSEMFEVISWNLSRGNSLLQLFELNKIYSKDKDAIHEKLHLSLGMCGMTDGSWKDKPRELDFFDLKGIVELFLVSLGVREYVIEKMDSFIFRNELSTCIKIGGNPVGVFGAIRPEIAKKFDIKEKVYVAELNMEDLVKHVNLRKRFSALPRYPSIKRDISLLVDNAVNASDMFGIIRGIGGDIVKTVGLFDLYRGQQVGEGKKSLAYRVEYRSDERTLKDEDINQIHKTIQEMLIKRLGVQIR